MAGPVANVRQTIEINGVDNASEAIKRAQSSLKGLGDQAKKTTDLTAKVDVAKGIDATKVQSTTQRAGGAFAALAAALGPTGQAIAEVGRSATALGSTANILPGPLGLAAAAVVGLGAGIYALGKYTSESAAKLALLGNADTARLKDTLDLSVDAAVELSAAFDGLKDKALRPTDALLAQVAKNAESMGKDGGKAAAEFVKALEGGPDALQRFQAEYGKLNGLIADNTALAARLGLNAELLGLTKATTDEEARQAEVAQQLARIQLQRLELAKVQADLDRARGLAIDGATVADRVNADISARALQAKAQGIQRTIDLGRSELDQAAHEATLRNDAADALARLAGAADVADAKATATADKRARAHAQSEANTYRQIAATRALTEFDKAHAGVLAGKLITERATLQAKVYQAEAAQLAAKEAKKQQGQQAAQEAASRRQALFDASVRIVKADADADGLQSLRERLALLDLEQAKELDGTKSVKSAKVRNLARLAIDADYADKRTAAEQAVADESNRIDEEHRKTLDEGNKRSADLAASAADAIAATAKAKTATIADALRAQGKDEEAELTERRQAQADYSRDLAKIDAERVARLATVVAASTDANNIQAEADAKALQAKIALGEAERRLDEAATQRNLQRRASAAQALEGPAKALQALAQLGPAFARSGALGQSMTAAVKGFGDLDKAMSKSKVNAAEVADAIGGTVAGVADAVITAETTRTIAQIDNETKRKLSTATTETERARITQEAEDKKTKALEDAERSKAGIMALVEGAKAIASAAEYDYVAAAGHGAAAVAYGAIAGGALGGPSAVGGGNTYSGGFNAAPSPSGGSGGSTAAGAGQTLVFNFNQPLATKQEVGKAVHGALRSLRGTGTDKAKGA